MIAAVLDIGLGPVHINVYDSHVRRRDLERELRDLGFEFLRHGGRHDIWSRGDDEIPLPRHTEINENLARAIIKRARRGR